MNEWAKIVYDELNELDMPDEQKDFLMWEVEFMTRDGEEV
jgi:hypothetical protein